jgi:hypothetical protein
VTMYVFNSGAIDVLRSTYIETDISRIRISRITNCTNRLNAQ